MKVIPDGYIQNAKGEWCHPSRVPKEYREKVRKFGAGYVKEFCGPPPATVKATQNDSVVENVSEHPKSPEDRLNKTEREFLGRLRSGCYGDKDYIGIQSITLQLGFDCRYTPDFWTMEFEEGSLFTFWEVKGFMRDDARVKLYAAARMFPFFHFVLVSKVKGQWEAKPIHQ